MYAFSQGAGSFSKLFEPSSLFTLAIVMVIIGICNYIKKQQQHRINQSLQDVAAVNGIKVIAIKPYRYVTQASALNGYDITIKNKTVTEVKENRSYSYTTAQAWEITLRNDSQASWNQIWFQYGEYDQHGRIREGEYKQEAVSDIRPGETFTATIQGRKQYDLVLENLYFVHFGQFGENSHHATFPVNLNMPKGKIIQFPVWIITVCIAAGFCMVASNVFLIVMAVVAVITALLTFMLSTLGSTIMPLLLYAALTEGLTVTAILCGLFLGLDWFTKKSWKDYFGAHSAS
ncbi:hypothetical protein [Chitinophaga sp. MM2321]|uniref:hypothetical protein n=1 Tax=Chitinophaga sp. MM2321 TaxID=3137178 RepID=UPI0032D59F21